MSRLTVILPAAGKGSRLNLPYPKEILKLDAHTALIDHSINFFRDYGRRDVDFVFVINEHKLELVKYLSRYKDRYNLTFTFQDPREQEYTGAIKSAAHLFGEHNLVLLPDTLMTLPPGVDLYETVIHCLTETGFTFLYKPERDHSVLETKGALVVDDQGLVKEYSDKPVHDLDRFNAFWCAFAFRRRAFNSAISFMEKSTLRQRVIVDEIKNTPIYDSQGIEVTDYVDLGTWDEIYRILNDKKDNN